MSKPNPADAIGRRNFLKGATAASAALAAAVPAAASQAPTPPTVGNAAPMPDIAAETMPPPADPIQQTSSGGDFMLDVLKALGFAYVTETPASTFRGLHETDHQLRREHNSPRCSAARTRRSRWRWRTATPRSRASRCWYCARYRRAAACVDGALQRLLRPVPVYMIDRQYGGRRCPTACPSNGRIGDRMPASWSAISSSGTTSRCSLQHFADSAVRAYKIAMTPPMGPVLLSVDSELQENPIPKRAALHDPKLTRVAIPQGDRGGDGSRAAAGGGGKSGDHRRSRRRARLPAWTR